MNEETKYITILDFEVGKVFQYKVKERFEPSDENYYEDYLTVKGHNLSNCEWMVHDDNELITNYMQVVTN